MTDPTDNYDILTTRGVTSEVKDDEGNPLGHALLLDYDGTCGYDRMISEIADLPGLTVVFESSPGSWHVWNTTVRNERATALQMLGMKADPQHTAIGYRRGRWTIRIGPKHRQNASAGSEGEPEEYKSAPDPITTFVNYTDRPQSRPHRNLALATLPEDQAKAHRDQMAHRCPTLIGDAYRAEAYRTMTDELKAEVSEGGR